MILMCFIYDAAEMLNLSSRALLLTVARNSEHIGTAKMCSRWTRLSRTTRGRSGLLYRTLASMHQQVAHITCCLCYTLTVEIIDDLFVAPPRIVGWTYSSYLPSLTLDILPTAVTLGIISSNSLLTMACIRSPPKDIFWPA